MSRYVNPYTDFGFKKLFGEESNKNLLIDFLNALLEGEQVIRDLTYLPNEQMPNLFPMRRAIFDIFCENERGDKFIVEMQRTHQFFFKDRTIFYSAFPIQQQAVKGALSDKEQWDFCLKPVYTVGLLDFCLDEGEAYRHDVKLVDLLTQEVFYDKLTYIYLELPKFKKQEGELVSRIEKWLYAFTNLVRLNSLPSTLNEAVFQQFFHEAEVAGFSEQEQAIYESSLKHYRDWNNSINSALKRGLAAGRAEGRAEGLEEGKRAQQMETARNALRLNLPVEQVLALSGLSEEDIQDLL